MFASLLSLALLSAHPAAGTLLTYDGEITAVGEELISKKIEYTALIVSEGNEGAHVYWLITEKGHGAWPWVEQFGQVEFGPRGKIVDGRPASALFEHADGISPVPLSLPVFAGAKELSKDAMWRTGRLQFKVSEPEDSEAAAKSWQVDVSTPIGHKRTVLVEKDRHVVTDVDEVVFVGPGKKHRLLLTLSEERLLPGESFENARSAFESMFVLREKLEHKTQGGRVQWSEEQLAMLKNQLPDIIEQAKDTPIETVALLAGGDVKLQKAVAAAAAQLQKQFVGHPVPRLELKSASLSGAALSTKAAEGKPLVLHIWEYKDNPLVEPYGQIGYLDFLYRRHKADGVQVFGISVDERLDQPDARSDAVRSVRKLQSFMNLGYPIVLGGRDVLDAFGDPRRLGAELPLVVVVDGKGKVTHYHLGLYGVDRENGLAELDAAVEKVK